MNKPYLYPIMKYLALLLFLISLAFSSPSQAQNICRLLLFAGDSADISLKTQRYWLLSDSSGIEKRDIWMAVFTDPKTFRRMYDYHNAAYQGFTLVLLGKDGEEKLRSDQPVPTKELFQSLDAATEPRVEAQN